MYVPTRSINLPLTRMADETAAAYLFLSAVATCRATLALPTSLQCFWASARGHRYLCNIMDDAKCLLSIYFFFLNG